MKLLTLAIALTEPRGGSDAANLRLKMPAGWPDKREFGGFTQTGWQTLLDVLVEAGTVKNRGIDLRKLYTNEFVPK